MASRKSSRRSGAPHSPQQKSSSQNNRRSTNTSSTPFAGIHNDAIANILAALIGKLVTLTLVDGSVYDGHFTATERSPKHPLNIVLRYVSVVARPTPSPSPAVVIVDLRGNIANRLVVPISVISVLRAAPPQARVASVHSRRLESSNRNSTSFATDTDISNLSAPVTRSLQRFDQFSDAQPVARVSDFGHPRTLDEQTFGDLASNSQPSQRWDQFQVNQDKFGVTTSFDENEYTTKLDRKGPNYEQRERQAARIASEIESAASENDHVREERNQSLSDDYDEEERYSGVQREPSNLVKPSAASADPPIRSNRPLSYAAAAAAGNVRTAGNKVVPQSRQLQKPTSQSHQGKQQYAKIYVSSKAQHSPKTSNNISSPQENQTGQVKDAQSMPSDRTKHASYPKKTSNEKGTSGKANTNPAKLKVDGSISTDPSVQKLETTSVKSSSPHTVPKKTNQTLDSVASTDSMQPILGKENAQLKESVAPASDPSTPSNEENSVRHKSKSISHRDSTSIGTLPQVLKVRSSISGILSPGQSRSSPSSAGTSTIGVLNLDAQPSQLGPEKIRQFNQFKIERANQAIKENRAQITDGFKEFRSKLDSKSVPSRRSLHSTGGASSGTLESPSISSSSISSGTMEKKPKTEFIEDGNSVAASTVEEKLVRNAEKPIVDIVKESVDTSAPVEHVDVEQSDDKVNGQDHSVPKMKSKLKSKLNPKAAEFKPSSFKAPTPPLTPVQPTFHHQHVSVSGTEFSQPMQAIPPGYAMPMQHMAQFAYGQPYAMMVPTPMPGTIPGVGGIPYIQGHGGMSIPMGQVPGRFQQNMGIPASYGYGPMVLAQPPQRMPPGGPYSQFYNGPPFQGAQSGSSPMSPPMQPPVFAQMGGGQHVGPHNGGPHNSNMHVQVNGNGGRAGGYNGNHGRRSGLGRARGRHGYNHMHNGHQNGHAHVPHSVNGEKMALQSADFPGAVNGPNVGGGMIGGNIMVGSQGNASNSAAPQNGVMASSNVTTPTVGWFRGRDRSKIETVEH